MSDPILHQVFSVTATDEANAYNLSIDITDMIGQRYTCDYVSRADDTFGLNPTIRQWLIDNDGSFTINPYVPPTIEDTRASMPDLSARQLRLGLISNGIMPSQVDAALNAMPAGATREMAIVEWDYASTFRRLHPLIASVGAALSLTDDQIDAMWMAAKNL